MKVLVIFPFDLAGQGGAETASTTLIRGLAAAHQDLIVISPESSAWVPPANVVNIPLPFKRINDPWTGLLFLYRNKWAIFETVWNQHVDLIHVPYFDIPASLPYTLKKWFPKVPLVITVHGAITNQHEYCRWHWSWKEPIRQSLRVRPLLYFEKKSIAAADKVIVISNSLSFVREDAVIIPDAVDLDLFNPNIKPALIRWKKYLVICSARLSPEKGQDILIRALSFVPEQIRKDIGVIFIGNDYLTLKKELTTLAINLGVESRIAFLDPKPYAEMPGIYKAANIIVVPSRQESLGMVIIENLALGNIVIASAVGGIPEIIQNGENGWLVSPDNPKELAEIITLVLKYPERNIPIKKNAIETAKKYSIESVTEQTFAVYREAVS